MPNPLFLTALAPGRHPSGSPVGCAMEAVSAMAGEPWSDSPKCVDPVICGVMQGLNDALVSNEERSAILGPLLIQTIGTRGSWDDTQARARLLAAWSARNPGPIARQGALLDLAGTKKEVESVAYFVGNHAGMDAGTAIELVTLLVAGLIPAGPCAVQEESHATPW